MQFPLGAWLWRPPPWFAPTLAPDHADRPERRIQKWQSSTDNWATTNEIALTDNPLATGNLSVSTAFRAVVTNGVCAGPTQPRRW